MKQYLVFLLALLMALSLVSCGAGEKETDGDAATQHKVQNTQNQTGQQTLAQTPAEGVNDDGEHHQRDRATFGHVPDFDVTEDFRDSHKKGAFDQRANSVMRFYI